jgi:hypothetical protein
MGSSIKDYWKTHTLEEVLNYTKIHPNCCGNKNGIPQTLFPTLDGKILIIQIEKSEEEKENIKNKKIKLIKT